MCCFMSDLPKTEICNYSGDPLTFIFASTVYWEWEVAFRIICDTTVKTKLVAPEIPEEFSLFLHNVAAVRATWRLLAGCARDKLPRLFSA